MPLTILNYALQILGVLPSLIEAGSNIKALIDHTNSALQTMQSEKRDPTQAEWDELNAKIDEARKALHS